MTELFSEGELMYSIMYDHVPAQTKSDLRYVEALKYGIDTTSTLRYHSYRLVVTSAEVRNLNAIKTPGAKFTSYMRLEQD